MDSRKAKKIRTQFKCREGGGSQGEGSVLLSGIRDTTDLKTLEFSKEQQKLGGGRGGEKR